MKRFLFRPVLQAERERGYDGERKRENSRFVQQKNRMPGHDDEGGNAKILSLEELRRDLEWTQICTVSPVLRGSARDNLIAETGCFVFDSLSHGEPMQLLKKWFSVLCPTRLKNELGSRV